MRRAALKIARSLYNNKQQLCSSSTGIGLSGTWCCGSAAFASESVFAARSCCSGRAPYHTTSRCSVQAAVVSQPSGKVIKQQGKPPSKLITLLANDLNYVMQGQSHSSSRAAFVFALPCLFTAFLGTWQIQRRGWKVDLLQARTSALQVISQLFWLQSLANRE